MKKAKPKLLRTAGKGNRPNRAFEEEETLFEGGEFGLGNPVPLQGTVWCLTSLYFGHRGRDESRKLKRGDIELKTDGKNGWSWSAMKGQRKLETLTELTDPELSPQKPSRTWETEDAVR